MFEKRRVRFGELQKKKPAGWWEDELAIRFDGGWYGKYFRLDMATVTIVGASVSHLQACNRGGGLVEWGR